MLCPWLTLSAGHLPSLPYDWTVSEWRLETKSQHPSVSLGEMAVRWNHLGWSEGDHSRPVTKSQTHRGVTQSCHSGSCVGNVRVAI